ncbi:MAG: phosphoenolpyruvate carboxylase [bacterium]|nr:phosphoenolpyruvate carboxylase [bacterium]
MKNRIIPATMATQHPDNANGPFWEKGDGFVSVSEEPEECVVCLRDLDVQEYMWDWEGKYADEAVIEKLFSNHYKYFRKNLLGKDKFLTFRLPNVWKEKGYSLIRALMVILTSEDFAHDLAFKSRPLFEAILPMTEKAEQLMYIQKSFQKLARFKAKVFSHSTNSNTDYVEIIPLIEGVEDQIHVKTLLSRYIALHEKFFHRKPAYLRPFLARSDPALNSGFVPNVLANKIALSDIYEFGKKSGVHMHPIIGAGSLIFRGGVSPARSEKFVREYGGVRTVTVQSGFRYDYPLHQVKKAINYFNKALPKSRVQKVEKKDYPVLLKIIETFSKAYHSTLAELLEDMNPFFQAVPKRRERRQHVGFLAYQRHMGKSSLPRAINFTAAWYSLGVPPEFIGLGRSLKSLDKNEIEILKKYYIHFKDDVEEAGRYINRENIRMLGKTNGKWQAIMEDIELAGEFLGVRFGPKSNKEMLHRSLSFQLLLQRKNRAEMSRLITETGKLRRSLG